MLLCPVRNCQRPLQREANRRVCDRGHSFDIARTGYTNLLQPQDRRSKHPGDSASVVAARRRIHDSGLTAPLLASIAQMAALKPEDQVLDTGCGDGFYLGNLTARSGATGHGVDISIPAVDAAARRYSDAEWIVANADRLLPYADRSCSVVLSITARMNVPEFARVVQPGGKLLIALAAPDDLQELRGTTRDRVDRTVAEFSPAFQLSARDRVTTTAPVPPATVDDLLIAIYRPGPEPRSEGATVTLSLDLLLFTLAS